MNEIKLFTVGVTGTNGKTSVTQWIAQALAALGDRCAIVGTLGNGFPGALAESPNTTPGAAVLKELMPEFVRQGATACAMEVSSIGLHQGRVAGIRFDVAVFTNFTRDHLDYHGTMAAYAAEKRKLFEMPDLCTAVLNLDDPFGVDLVARLKGRVATIGYTLEGGGGTDTVLSAVDLVETGAGIAFTLDGVRFTAPVVGRFNASNLLAVTGALLAGGRSLPEIAAALAALVAPAGRMETLGGDALPLVVVDYAHSPDALEKVLTTLSGTAAARGGKLVCVFGCGGDRDAGKRPLMGAIAERLADQVILTSDNPRSEDPQAIIAAIRAGVKGAVMIEADRAAAIRLAVREADANDVILLAGKGHEPYQEIAGVRLPFSDCEIAQSALAGRRERSALTGRRDVQQPSGIPGEPAEC
ncbi:MAG: UDP-N-acetylmuramoyl-L-alanyl-D-glutamate--2,6-diaminopimelate ligase [Rhodocyclaceae bacterium]|nr:UDP-N-acetylmuramoyl-L-alanyl-D-glutamate--2,6-diaminopimelate ligase [Rhodocyclaceae bacterium]